MAEPLYPLLSLTRLRMGIDGTGVVTLAAGAGCPLNCRWCINKRLLREAPAEMVTAEELLERVRVDDLYFRATGGGVTFGGGESLLHVAFLKRFRELCPAEWHLSAETSLAVPPEQVRLAAGAIDAFIVDCKDMDGAIYRRYTGGDGALMESNLRLLLSLVGPERIRVRVPRIPSFNTAEDQRRSAERLRALGLSDLELFDYVVREE
ncbi:MAG: radical SAM protein [Oscillospiraceae bacterium]|nr:radical SAM protein [Oscillospiraceae bacterium]